MRIRVLIVGSLLCGLASSVFADSSGEALPLDLQARTERYHVNYVLNDDATLVEMRERAVTILKPSALDWAKQTSVSYSTSVQKLDIVEAYTRKADGRRIDVPQGNYQLRINKGREPGGPVFSDNSSTSVVFPDVAVGDTVVLSYRIEQSEAIFPRHFSVSEMFPPQMAVDDVRVRIEYPESMWVQFEARGMRESISSPNEGRKRVEWTYSNSQPLKSDRRDYSVVDPDQETGYAFSTFHSYADIASAYAERALPKATVTERVSKLAEEIAGNAATPRDKARVLYEWLIKNITYAGNCVGIGAVVPHDLSFVLNNKMGDCKDRATLLQALLAAQDIESYQVLINSGNIYNLPRIPVVANVNHVLNYLPAFDLYVDATSDSTPFGMLPAGDRGKPVLLVGQQRPNSRTPTPLRASEQKWINKLQVAEDGSMSGSVELFLKGDSAVAVREWARNLPREKEMDFVKEYFRSFGMVARGTLKKDDPSALTDSYHLKVNIDKAEKFLRLSGGAFVIRPLFGGASIQSMVPQGAEEDIRYETACTNGSAEEHYEIEFPRNMKIISVPKNLKLAGKHQSYQARYALKRRVLTVRRYFEDITPTSVCSPEISAEYARVGEKVTENLSSQVLFK